MNIFEMSVDDLWRKRVHSITYKEGFEEGYCNGYCKGRKDAAPKWTPVSEGLPEENKVVLVTAVFSDGQTEVGTLRLIKGRWTNDYFSYDIIAWMPLPEPFEEVKK